MAGIFDGLEKFGLTELTKAELYEKKNQNVSSHEQKAADKPFDIKDYTYSKSFECPVCGKTFVSSVIRTAKVRLISIDFDLRPVYEPVDPMLYDVVTCVNCGYGAVLQRFNRLSDAQIDLVHTHISSKFTPFIYPDELTVDMAIERYKLALINTMVKKGSVGEKAYICMKLSWLHRMKEDKPGEMLFVQHAYEGFAQAFTREDMPIMGLGENTILYLLGAFAKMLGKNDDALRYVTKVILSKTASNNLKERARDLKEVLRVERQDEVKA